MRQTVFSERYCDRLTFLSEKLLIHSEGHVASKTFQPGFALIPSNLTASLFCQCFSSPFGPKHIERVEPSGTVCGSMLTALCH